MFVPMLMLAPDLASAHPDNNVRISVFAYGVPGVCGIYGYPDPPAGIVVRVSTKGANDNDHEVILYSGFDEIARLPTGTNNYEVTLSDLVEGAPHNQRVISRTYTAELRRKDTGALLAVKQSTWTQVYGTCAQESM
jgi:hypothetical protein